MLILAIDTSAGTAVALLEGGSPEQGGPGVRPLVAEHSDDPRHHAEQLAPMIASVLSEAGRDRSDIDLFAVGTGPAPFTGLRVGLVTARALARSLGVPLVGVPSLDALGRTALDALGSVTDGGAQTGAPPREVVVVSDARRREVYGARVRERGDDDVETLSGPLVAAPADVLAELGVEGRGDVLIAGPGTGLHPETLPPRAGLPERIDLGALARLALARRGAGAAPTDTTPLYLRRPDVHTRSTTP